MNTIEEFEFNSGPHILDPRAFVELSRPSEGRANAAGDLAFAAVSKFSIFERKNHESLWIAALDTKLEIEPCLIALPDGGSAFWIDDRTIGLVASKGENKTQDLYAISVKFNLESHPPSLSASTNHTLIGSFPEGASASNFRYSSKGGILVFSALVWPDRNLSNVKTQDEGWDKRGDSALVYDDLYARHWDTWRGPKVLSLFCVKLSNVGGKWILGDGFMSLLKGTKHNVPIEPFGGLDNFSIFEDLVVYTTKDSESSHATHTRQNIYIINVNGKESPKHLTSGTQGLTNFPIFNTAGDKVAWTEQDRDGCDTDRSKIVIYDLVNDVRYTLTQTFDRSVVELCFSLDDKYVYFTARDIARTKIYRLRIPPTPTESTAYPDLPAEYQTPVALTETRASSGIQVLSHDRILCSQSSFVSPNDIYIIHGIGMNAKPQLEKITYFTEGELKNKDMKLPDEIWFDGAEGRRVHAWVSLPPGLSKEDVKKWPAILMIHGGPQYCVEDAWDPTWMWNMLLWAHQGYVVFQPNITGSTTFGQGFTDAINKDWGGKPFIDLRNGWNHFLKEYPQADPERCVAAGASFAGYCINWIQGHPEWNMGFKALFCQCGVFDLQSTAYSTDEIFFLNHEFGGEPWLPEVKECIRRSNPSELVEKWSIPQLLIHNANDFRIPVTEGIAAFHALQQRGIPSRLVVFTDENHMITKHLNLLKCYYEIFCWFKKYSDGSR